MSSRHLKRTTTLGDIVQVLALAAFLLLLIIWSTSWRSFENLTIEMIDKDDYGTWAPLPAPPQVVDSEKDVLMRNLSYAEHLKYTRLVCGPLCSVPSKLKTMQHSFTRLMTPQDLAERFIDSPPVCKNLFGPLATKLFDLAANAPPPARIPSELKDDFLMHGLMGVRYQHYVNVYAGGAAHLVWTREHIDDWITQARLGELNGTYGRDHTQALAAAIVEAGVVGKKVLVIGSEFPWVEALCLAVGARHVTTLEYAKITSGHPQLSTLMPHELTALVAKGLSEDDKFDLVVTYSSIEHSGLGRYGDQLNPWGDVITVARAWCLMKPKGIIIIGVPGCAFGLDWLIFNAHRHYGRARLALILANFRASKLRFFGDDSSRGIRCMNFHNRMHYQLIVTAERA